VSGANASGHVLLVERKRGNVFFAKLRVNGKQIKKKLGLEWTGKGRPPSGYLTRKMAESALDDLLVSYRRGEMVIQNPTDMTFGEAVDAYLEWLRNDRKRKLSYIKSLEYLCDALKREFGESTPVEKIDADRLDRYRRSLISNGRSASTVNKHLIALNGIFRLACKVADLRVNPMASIEKQPIPAKNDFETYEPDELFVLADHALSEQDAAMFLVAGFCGLRMGELRALEWEDIRWDEKSIIVRHNYVLAPDTPKSGMGRSVPLPDPVAAALAKAKLASRFNDRDDLVFPSESGGVLAASTIRRRFKTASKRAGLRTLRFHDLRHTAATLMARIYSPFEVMENMGHSSMEITRKYVHHKPKASAADAMTEMIARSRRRAA